MKILLLVKFTLMSFGCIGLLKNVFSSLNTKLFLNEIESVNHYIRTTTASATATAERREIATAEAMSSDIVDTDGIDIQNNGICALFPKQFTASSLWKSNLDHILQASLHRTNSQDFINATHLTDILYNVLSTERLRKGLRARPSNEYHAVSRVIEIIERKLMDDKAPPLTVAVFGGSVTVGRGCDPQSNKMVDRECAWPRKLELLINQLASREVVKIYNMGTGGTNTKQGNIFVKYWMYPEEIRENGPDVIVNSYSTNDSLPSGSTPEKMIAAIQDILERTRTGLQLFVRYALLGRSCSKTPPLVVHVDDYIGHQNTESLLGELSYNTGMVQIANWYGTMAVSYPDTIRDIVYQDTSESQLSPQWISKKHKKKYKVEVHYTYKAHYALAWVVAYSSLEVLSNYCDDLESIQPANTSDIESTKAFSIPPPLDESLKISDVSQKWKAGPIDYEGHGIDCSDPDKSQNPCALTWIAGPLGIFRSNQLNSFMKQYVTSARNWGAKDDMKQGWSNKLGWEAMGSNASFSMQLNDLSKEVHVVTIFYMRSYGEKWANSKARFTIQDGSSTNTTNTATVDLFGTHNSTTSISYTKRIVLPNSIPKGGSLNLQVDLVGGSTFKISGMMFCSW